MKEKKLNEFYENLWSMAILASDVYEEDLEEGYDKVEILKSVYGDELLAMIADEEQLQYVETTIGMNGYPRCISGALIGFNDFTHFERIRDEYELNSTHLKRREGHQLWNRKSDYITKPYELIPDNFVLSCNFWYKGDEKAFTEETIEDLSVEYEDFFNKYNAPTFDNFDDINEWAKNIEQNIEDDDYATFENFMYVLNERYNIYLKILNLEGTKVVISHCSELHDYDVETIVMSYTEDVYHYAIGLEL